MAKIIGLPKLSPTMEEGTLVSWAKKEGDAVEVDDLLAEVETDKATMEFRSFDKGVLLKILVDEGATLEAEEPVAIIGKEGEDISDLLAQVEAGGASAEAGDGSAEADDSDRAKDDSVAESDGSTRAAAGEKAASAGDGGRDEEAAAKRDQEPDGETTSSKARSGAERRASNGADGERILSSPLVRKLARERDIDLSEVDGSGPHGRIIKRDIEGYEKPSAPARPASGDRQPPRVEQASSMRRTIARRLTESKQTVPHYYLTIDTDIAPLSEARKAMNAALEDEGRKVSLNDLIIKAAAVSLRRVPEVNASWMGKEIHYHQVVDISVAVAVDEGLMTPVVRDADRKGVAEIADEVKDLAARARNRKLSTEEMTNGTFSISNLGMFGIEEFAAVINPPEAAILAVGTIREEPVVQDGAVVPGRRMRFTMSCDHRVVDGAVGAKFMAAFKRIIESPLNMLL